MSSFKPSFGAELLHERQNSRQNSGQTGEQTAGHTRFRLWAPSAKAARVLIGETAYPMQALPDGWYEMDIHCGAGTHYRFETKIGRAHV